MSPRRLPPLGALRAFEAAARMSSFKKAAAELSVTPGAVSQQVRGLEDQLGVKLFVRTARAVTPTEGGARLQRALTAAFLSMRQAVDEARPDQRRELRLHASSAINGKWLLPRLHRFAQRYPDQPVAIQSSDEPAGFDGDVVDVAIQLAVATDPSLFSVRLCDEHVLPLASPALVQRLTLRAPRDLARAPLLHDLSCAAFADAPDWAGWFERVGLDPAGAARGVRFDRSAADHALDAAANGAGVVLGRRFLARSDMLVGRLVAPCGPAIRLQAGYVLTCRRGEETKPDIAAFINWMVEEAAAVADGAAADMAAF